MPQIRGLAYPLAVDENGSLLTSTDLASVEDQIVSVLETRPYERVMRADYGLNALTFKTLEPNAINAQIYNAVMSQVPSLSNLEVVGDVTDADGGFYGVTLRYSVNGIPQPPLSLTLNF